MVQLDWGVVSRESIRMPGPMNPLSMATIDFSRLRVDRDELKGVAPHKPLLLLAVLDWFEAGGILADEIWLCPDLVVRFQNYWPIVAARRGNRGDIRLPFHALATDKVWQVFDSEGRPSRARQTSTRAVLSHGFQRLLQSEPARRALRRLLIARYFSPGEQWSLAEAVGLPLGDLTVGADRVEEDAAYYEERRRLGRTARFRNSVITGYVFTCALTGYRITTAEQVSVIEAAHIHSLSRSRNNEPENGLALSPTAHALFDLGLWSIRDDFTIIVKPEKSFTESSPVGSFSLRAFANRPLHFERRAVLRPHVRHLLAHRAQHGFAHR